MEMEVIFPGGKRVDALYRGFTIKTDQKEKYGGGDSEPAPFDLFLASIGTCAGIFVLNFCHQRNIPPEKTKLIMRTERDEQAKMISKVSIEIHVPPEFPEKYKRAIIKAASLCSVKKHIEKPPVFEIDAIIDKPDA